MCYTVSGIVQYIYDVGYVCWLQAQKYVIIMF
jgi:hypothetical protein